MICKRLFENLFIIFFMFSITVLCSLLTVNERMRSLSELNVEVELVSNLCWVDFDMKNYFCFSMFCHNVYLTCLRI